MGRRGPPPQPTVLRLVGGNASKRSFNANEAVMPHGPLDPPPDAIMDEAAVTEWNRIHNTLTSKGLACPIDSPMVIMWCVTWSRFLKAAAFVRDNGTQYPVRRTRRNPDGTTTSELQGMKEFPMAREFRALQINLVKIAHEIGMTPSARSRINAESGAAAGGKTRDEAALRKKFFGGA